MYNGTVTQELDGKYRGIRIDQDAARSWRGFAKSIKGIKLKQPNMFEGAFCSLLQVCTRITLLKAVVQGFNVFAIAIGAFDRPT